VPKTMTLRQMLDLFLEHRLVVIVRRSRYELAAAEKRAHILEGYRIALDNLDAVITLIRESKDPAEARIGLMEKFGLSEIQAKAILELQLQRLTNMERKKIDDEYNQLLKTIEYLRSLLASEAMQREVVRKELVEVREKYGDARRTKIMEQLGEEFSIEELIADEEMLIMVTVGGYIKRLSTGSFNEQGRGGIGVIGSTTKEEDYVYDLLTATTHSYLLFFTTRGQVYKVRVADIPVGGKAAKGKHISNLLAISEAEKVTAFVPVRDFKAGGYLFMATKDGTVKKTAIADFGNVRLLGINAINLHPDDRLMQVEMSTGDNEIVLITRSGKAIRFSEKEVRPMGRATAGVRGIRLRKGDELVDMVVVKPECDLLIVTSGGFAKRTPVSGFTMHHRGGGGVICMRVTKVRGQIVAVLECLDGDSIIVATESGKTIRTGAEELRSMGRSGQGVRLVKLHAGDKVAGVDLIRE
jgi:DNA gyrase subunit A